MTGNCLCDHEFEDCPTHVQCDEDCKALAFPESRDEWYAAALHWRSHHYLGGCSHAR